MDAVLDRFDDAMVVADVLGGLRLHDCDAGTQDAGLADARAGLQDAAIGAALANAMGDGDPVTFRPPPDWRL